MDHRRLIRSAGLVSLLTLLSRVLGLVRDVIMAGFFGTGLVASSFFFAFRLPNLFRRLFGEGALSAAFVPAFIGIREKQGEASAWVFARRMLSLALLILSGLAGLLIIGLGLFPSALSAEGAPGVDLSLVVPLARIMLPYAVFICLTALCMGLLNSYRHFTVPAATPCLLNLIWIASLYLLCPRFGDRPEEQIYGLAWGILIAGVVQLACQLPVLIRHGYKPGWDWKPRDPQVRKVLWIALPAAVGAAVTQVNVLIDSGIALWVGEHAVAALFYSERLIYLPLGIFATALGTVLLPTFSKQAASAENEAIRATMNHSLRNLLFVMIPAAIGLFVLAKPIIRMIFEWKAFDAQSTFYTSTALMCYAPGLVVFSLAKVFIPAFYARQDTKTPVKFALLTVVLNLALNITFVLTWPAQYKHAGLACATVLAEAFYAVCLGATLHRRYGSPGWRSVASSAFRFLVAGAGMAVVAWYLQPVLQAPLEGALGLKPALIVSTLTAIAVSAGCYFLLAALLRCRELREVLDALRRK